MSTSVLILTSSFPYLPGEEFIESEALFWKLFIDNDIKVYVCPLNTTGQKRLLPPGIQIKYFLSRSIRRKKVYYYIYALKALFSLIFWKEILYKKCNFSVKKIITALKTTAGILLHKDILNNYYKNKEFPNIIYSYWFDIQAYAAAIVFKNKSKIVTRAHGFDVYAERRDNSYMPVKWQFKDVFDYIFAISEEGKKYLHQTYKIPENKLAISRLGVIGSSIINNGNPNENELNILSISFCVKVKRIDKIIDALSIFCDINSDYKVNWSHIGDGTLKKYLEEYSKLKLSKFKNISYKFYGYFSNKEVIQYIENKPVDIFINASESEGVPVSIMEVMSRGIPVIAPAVGGIPEQIVNKENGILLSANPSSLDIANAITENIAFFKNKNTRIITKKYWNDMYNAEKNYTNFIKFLTNII